MLRIYNKTGRIIFVSGTKIPINGYEDLLVPYDTNLRNMVRNKLISVKEIEEKSEVAADVSNNVNNSKKVSSNKKKQSSVETDNKELKEKESES